MRIIKFRVWDIAAQRIRKVEYLDFDKKGNITHVGVDNGVTMHSNTWSLMQYTGLKDKNGKEIYEGDICNIFLPNSPKPVYGEVIWGKKFCEFAVKYDNRMEGDSLGNYIQGEDLNIIEIIGNIYEKNKS